MNEKEYKKLFMKIIKEKHGIEIDFEKIEKKLQHIREGDALNYHDLKNIADENCWPFNEYWMWPTKKLIKHELKKTKNWFINLPNNEQEIIDGLNGIFKNIALVSIILRFVCPAEYAIYSRPPLKILRTRRGANDTEEYLNYVNDLKLIKKSINVKNTSDVDTIVWAVAQREKDKLEILDEFHKILAIETPKDLSPKDLIESVSDSPLKTAEIFLMKKDYITSGMWTARAFEEFLYTECERLMGFIPLIEKDRIFTLTEYLCMKPKYKNSRNYLNKLRKLRVKAVHIEGVFTKEDAYKFFREVKILVTQK